MPHRFVDNYRLSRRGSSRLGVDAPYRLAAHDPEAAALIAWLRRTRDELVDLDDEFTRRWDQ